MNYYYKLLRTVHYMCYDCYYFHVAVAITKPYHIQDIFPNTEPACSNLLSGSIPGTVAIFQRSGEEFRVSTGTLCNQRMKPLNITVP